MHVHGGGPGICREELDIYSAEAAPETELVLHELQGKGAKEYCRRISRQFVDECRGDLDTYSQKYGPIDGDPMQVDVGNEDMEDAGGSEDLNIDGES